MVGVCESLHKLPREKKIMSEAYWCERHQIEFPDYDEGCPFCAFEEDSKAEAERRRAGVYGDIAASIERHAEQNRPKEAPGLGGEVLAALDEIPVIVRAVRDAEFKAAMIQDRYAAWAEEPDEANRVRRSWLKSWPRLVHLLLTSKRVGGLRGRHRWPQAEDIDRVTMRLVEYLFEYYEGVDHRRKDRRADAKLAETRRAALVKPGLTGPMLGCRALDQIPSGGWQTMIADIEAEAERRPIDPDARRARTEEKIVWPL
jgi:hypothetical protein